MLPPTALFGLLLLLWLGVFALEPPPPHASCGPEGCYAVYFQRRSFLEAWRSCREMGGNLATLKRAEEATQVEQLLQSHAESGMEQPRRLFWIGLQRPPRQCHPQRPLRGFAWTTGEQETSYTNWASSAVGSNSVGCSAPRCVVLDDVDFEWIEGSCTVPVDGLLCHFTFRGMCPGLDGAHSESRGLRAVSYSTPFGPSGPGLAFVPFGTVAAVICAGTDPSGPSVASLLCLEKEDGSVAWSETSGILCPEQSAHFPMPSGCEGDNGGCQQLCLDEADDGGYSCECHDGYYLLPDGHSCAQSSSAHDPCPCPFGCQTLPDGSQQCQCPAGYEPSDDHRDCLDVDECAEVPCDHQCENTEGSFLCRCHLGFGPSEEDPSQCTDTDECQFPGVCQQMCVNYVGGFECYCTEGYELDADGISCLLVANLPPLATAESHPQGVGGGYFQPFGHGWPPERDMEGRHFLDDRWTASDAFSVFRDVEADASPSIPDPRVVPRMVPDTEPPDVHLPPLDWSPTEVEPQLPSLELEWKTSSVAPTPGPTHTILPTSDPTLSSESNPDLTTPDTPTQPPLLSTGLLDVNKGAAVWRIRALPATPTPPSPTPIAEESGAQVRRDDRWLLVALLVPLCVFLVIMLALGIVYCTRCGAQAKTRSVTQCYRWVISSAGKGAAPPAPSSRPGQGATCRTSV
ncbi:endosialin [Anolis sagrei]|uniref:endosialin n=1 Tax=Anolis sagrei TaxID=38937 RepID=UPI003522085B